ncbi:nuclear transport factor 2 family protein [Streptomyces sp. Y7]|uniref:nuclear transport factor 2 family protein n=1 Tax=Streptomyces sp. Y7 TaxID=3342392 RepID=UPI0037177C37
MSNVNTDHIAEVFAAIESQDVPTILSMFAEDVSTTFGNEESKIGRAQIGENLAAFHQTIAGLRHTILKTWSDETDVVIEASVTYDRLDGRQVTLPTVTIISYNDAGKITSYRVYFDLAPVYAP